MPSRPAAQPPSRSRSCVRLASFSSILPPRALVAPGGFLLSGALFMPLLFALPRLLFARLVLALGIFLLASVCFAEYSVSPTIVYSNKYQVGSESKQSDAGTIKVTASISGSNLVFSYRAATGQSFNYQIAGGIYSSSDNLLKNATAVGGNYGVDVSIPLQTGTYKAGFATKNSSGTQIGFYFGTNFSVTQTNSALQAPTLSIAPSATAAAGTSMTISFAAVANATSYKLCAGVASGVYSSCAAIKSPYTFPMAAGFDKYVAVKAVNAQGESAYSDALHLKSTTSAPTSLQAPVISIAPSATAATGTILSLSFAPVPNATSYQLCYGSSSGNYTKCMPVTSPYSIKMTDGMDYYVAVKAVNTSLISGHSNELHVKSTSNATPWGGLFIGSDYDQTILIGNKPPIYTLSLNQTTAVRTGQVVRLSADAVDTDSSQLFFFWAASDGQLRAVDAQYRAVDWKAPQIPGTYYIRGSVGDGNGNVSGAYAIFNVQ